MNVNDVFERLYKSLGITKDIEFAEMLDKDRSNVTNWRKRESIPYEVILNLCMERGISSDYVFLGKMVTNNLNKEFSDVVFLYEDEKELLSDFNNYGMIKLKKDFETEINDSSLDVHSLIAFFTIIYDYIGEKSYKKSLLIFYKIMQKFEHSSGRESNPTLAIKRVINDLQSTDLIGFNPLLSFTSAQKKQVFNRLDTNLNESSYSKIIAVADKILKVIRRYKINDLVDHFENRKL